MKKRAPGTLGQGWGVLLLFCLLSLRTKKRRADREKETSPTSRVRVLLNAPASSDEVSMNSVGVYEQSNNIAQTCETKINMLSNFPVISAWPLRLCTLNMHHPRMKIYKIEGKKYKRQHTIIFFIFNLQSSIYLSTASTDIPYIGEQVSGSLAGAADVSHQERECLSQDTASRKEA